jgi:hypothetical protein
LAHVHAVPAENCTHRSSVDAEPITQLVHTRSGLIAGDEVLDLLGVELACPPWFGAVERVWWGRVASVAVSPGLLPVCLCCSKFPQGPHMKFQMKPLRRC